MSDEPLGTEPPATGEILDDGRQPPGEWLAPAAAASRLGVSERTLWRLVKNGRYHKRTERGRAEVLVPLPDDPANGGAQGAGTGTAISAVSGAQSSLPDTLALAILEELRRQREDDAERLSRQAETIGRLTAELNAARAELVALRATQAPPEPTAPAPSGWRRWLPWLAGAG